MADDPPRLSLYEVPYLRLFPWLRIFRCPGSAADPKRLILGALGILLLQAGWAGLDRVFPIEYGISTKVGWLGKLDEYRADHTVVTSDDPVFRVSTDTPREAFRDGIPGFRPWKLAEPAWTVTAPFATAFDPSTAARPFAHAVLAGLWALAVWGLFGGAIARVAAVDLARGERVGLAGAVRFSAGKAGSLVGTPLVPLVAAAMVALPIGAFGLLYRLPGSAGPVLAGGLAFLPLLGGLVLTMIVVGLAVGWPLMHASVAAESEDGFDAMSRAYAYVHQRPWHYAAYLAVAVAAGCAGLWFVDLFAGLVVRLSAWGLGLGAPGPIVQAFYGPRPVPPPFPEATSAVAAHGFWLSAVALLARGWVYSYFWTAATATYLLLRRDVDGTPWGTVAYKSRPGPLTEAVAHVEPENPEPVPAPHAPELQDAGDLTGA